jgi:hypothetical protein
MFQGNFWTLYEPNILNEVNPHPRFKSAEQVNLTSRSKPLLFLSSSSSYLIKHVMKAYGGMDAQLNLFLAWTLVRGEWSASRPGRFTLLNPKGLKLPHKAVIVIPPW